MSRKRAPRLRAGGFCLVFSGMLALLACGCQDTSASGTSGSRPGTEVSVPPPLTATYETPEALAEAFLEALRERDREALLSFALSEEEFRAYVWPELPASATWPFEYGWKDLRQKSLSSLTRTYNESGGRPLDFLEIRFKDETTDYGSYRVHRDARVRVRDGKGEEVWLDLFGSVMEYEGRFKLFSYVTD